MWSVDQLGQLQPDAVVVDPVLKEILILEYTMPSDTQPQALGQAAESKTIKYQVLLIFATVHSSRVGG